MAADRRPGSDRLDVGLLPPYRRCMLIVLVVLALLLIAVGGYLYNRGGPGDLVGDPEVKNRRNTWVP